MRLSYVCAVTWENASRGQILTFSAIYSSENYRLCPEWTGTLSRVYSRLTPQCSQNSLAETLTRIKWLLEMTEWINELEVFLNQNVFSQLRVLQLDVKLRHFKTWLPANVRKKSLHNGQMENRGFPDEQNEKCMQKNTPISKCASLQILSAHGGGYLCGSSTQRCGLMKASAAVGGWGRLPPSVPQAVPSLTGEVLTQIHFSETDSSICTTLRLRGSPRAQTRDTARLFKSHYASLYHNII